MTKALQNMPQISKSLFIPFTYTVPEATNDNQGQQLSIQGSETILNHYKDIVITSNYLPIFKFPKFPYLLNQ